jgi:diaminopimelate epimerase
MHRAWVAKTKVAVEIKLQSVSIEHKKLKYDNNTIEGFLLNTGVPHFVTFVMNVHDEKWMEAAPELRRSPALGRAGANVNFLERRRQGKYACRVYERGVERETLSCGTGLAAAAHVIVKKRHEKYPITFYAQGGVLTVKQGKSAKVVILEGAVTPVFSGTLDIQTFSI